MADQKLTAVRSTSPFVSPLAAADLIYLVQDTGSTPDERAMTAAELATELRTKKRGRWYLPNPSAIYAIDPHVILFKTDAAITISRIMLRNSLTGTEIAGDLKWASDMLIGSYADAAVIDVCDTTSGVFEVTSSMDDPTVPTAKYVYLQLDATPSALIKYCLLEVDFTYD